MRSRTALSERKGESLPYDNYTLKYKAHIDWHCVAATLFLLFKAGGEKVIIIPATPSSLDGGHLPWC